MFQKNWIYLDKHAKIIRKWVRLLLVTAMMSSIISSDQVPEEYKLVWSDEFDVDGEPDQNHWAYEYGFVRNQELQW